MNCKTCGVTIKSFQTEVDLQKAKEEFTAEYQFMSIGDRIDRRKAIDELKLKLSLEKNGFCCLDCAEAEDVMQEQLNGFNHSRGL